MSCQIRSEEHTDHLLAYSAGKLHGEAAAALELHMRNCEECAALGKAQSGVWNLLDNWEVRPVSADFNRRLYARIDAAASESWLDRAFASANNFFRPVFARPAFPLAAASLVIVAGFVFDHPGRSLFSGSKPAQLHASSHASSMDVGAKAGLNAVEADQVESTLEDMEMLRQFVPKQDDGNRDSSSKSM